MRQIRQAIVGLGLGLGLAGCLGKGEEVYPFPEGLEPLSESEATWPSDQEEVLSTTTGEGEEYDWAHGRGYVHAGIEDVYSCLREDMVNVDRRKVTSWSVVEDVEEGYEHSYRIDNVVEDIIDVEFSDTWRHGRTEDDAGEVVFINSRWKMTAANCCIDVKEGSIVTTPVEASVTGVELVGHLAALQGDDQETMRSYLEDFYADLLACVAGEAYPSFD